MKQGDTNSDMRWSRLTLRAQVTIVVFAGFFVVELLSVVVDIAQIHATHKAEVQNRGNGFLEEVLPLLAGAPPEARTEIARNSSNSERHVVVGEHNIAGTIARSEQFPRIASWIQSRLSGAGLAVADLSVADQRLSPSVANRHEGVFTEFTAIRGLGETPRQVDDPPIRPTVGVYSVRMEGETKWFNFFLLLAPVEFTTMLLTRSLDTLIAFVLMGILLFLIGRVMRPLDALTINAESFGRGEEIGNLTPQGSVDVRETIIAFNRMKERIVQSFDYQLSLLRSLSHDLNGPLSRLRDTAGAVDSTEDREQVLRRLSVVEEIVGSVANFTRETHRDAKTTRIDLPSLLEALVEEEADAGHDATISLDMNAVVRGRHNALIRVFRNLIENALKYGGSVHVIASQENDTVIVAIEDEGPGIDPDNLDTAFDPFQRLDAEGPGTGLGLAIARTVIVDHGGEVSLSNRASGGLRATVMLPAEPAP